MPWVGATGLARAETAAKAMRPASGLTAVRISASIARRDRTTSGSIMNRDVAGTILAFSVIEPANSQGLDQGREHRRPHFERTVVLRFFDIDDFGITRAETAQFVAYSSGIMSVVEHFPPMVIG